MVKSTEHEAATDLSKNEPRERVRRSPAWRAATDADPPQPRPLMLTLALLALALWAAFLAYTAWA